MLKPQRRVFLKVIAAGPFVGCAGAGGEETAPAAGGTDALGGTGAAGTPPSTGGSSPAAGGGSSAQAGVSATGGNPFSNNGNPAGGNFFGSAGSTNGGSAPSGGRAGASAGGSASTGVGGIGTMNEHGTLVAHVGDVPVGWFGIVDALFFMGRDANGIYAMSMQCTHKFCALVISGAILDCPCHHSHFDRDGKVLMGPATTPLPHYAVFIDGAGNIFVDRFTTVSASMRYPV